MPPLQYFVSFIIIGTVFLLALWVYRILVKKDRLQKQYQRFSIDSGLSLQNGSKITTFTGKRGIYNYTAEYSMTEMHIYIEMNNPQQKGFYLFKKTATLMDVYVPAPKQSIAHTFSADMEAYTNDLVFASLVFSEDIRTKIEGIFSTSPTAQLYLKDGKMGWHISHTWGESNALCLECMDILSLIKTHLKEA